MAAQDQNGVVQYEQVIKEWAYDSQHEISGKRGLSKEAVAQYQMNQQGNEHAPILRNSEFAEDQNFRYNSKWRTYSEFCPMGTWTDSLLVTKPGASIFPRPSSGMFSIRLQRLLATCRAGHGSTMTI